MAPKTNAQKKAEAEAKLAQEIKDMDVPDTIERGGLDVSTGCFVFTPDEYAAYSKANGRIMGRPEGTKTKCTIEELRALINSEWTPSMIMEKHGMDAEEFKQLVWKLSKREMRGKPIKYSISRDSISREG